MTDDVKVINVPERIYLQIGDDFDPGEVDFSELQEVTWCADDIHGTDIAYVRAGALEAANARIAELEARPTAWVWCDSIYEEHCHLTDEEAIEDGWRPMVYSDMVPKLASKDARIALEQAQALISENPHGDNCFVSNHYGGDPGNVCYCGKSIVLDSIDRALAEFPPQVKDEDLYGLLPGTYYMDPPDGGEPGLLEMLKRLALDAGRYRYITNRVVITDKSTPGMAVITFVDDAVDEPNQFLDELVDAALAKQQDQS